MIKFFTLAFLVLLMQNVNGQNANEEIVTLKPNLKSKKIVGTWYLAGYSSENIELLANGNFFYREGADIKKSGKYSFNKNILTLMYDNKKMKLKYFFDKELKAWGLLGKGNPAPYYYKNRRDIRTE